MITSVDATTETLMQTLILSHFHQHTILAVTHRPSTVLDFDLVLVLENGQIVESGASAGAFEEGWLGFRSLQQCGELIRNIPEISVDLAVAMIRFQF